MRALHLFFVPLTLLSLVAQAQLPSVTITPHSPPRIFASTNTDAAFFTGVLNGRNANGFHGITQEKQKFFEQYWIHLGEDLLDPSTARVTVTPAGFTREYPLHGTVEQVFFADSITLLGVVITTNFRGSVRIIPAFSRWWEDGMQSIHGDMYRIFKQGLQAAAAVNGLAGEWEVLRPRDAEAYTNPAPVHLPLRYRGECRGEFAFSVGYVLAGYPPVNRDAQSLRRLSLRREKRIAAMLASTDFVCPDTAVTEAFRWITTSMDALVMRQMGGGIYAGLPWFDDYWGRDTFIALPGALLVTGRFEEAEQVLRSFLRYLDRDTNSSTYGRIPNRIQPRDIIYNTVDGTPWMVIQAWQYALYSGNVTFLRDILPDVERTIAGALRYTDANFLLTHASAETWMDAVGPDGPWSPRGTRAVEIQALWYAQLRAASEMARAVGDTRRADGWQRYAERVRESMVRMYVDADRMHIDDHIDEDGTPDPHLRPNILLPFSIPGSDVFDALPDSVRRGVLRRLFAETVFPWGVASLSQYDEQFHPWHDAPRHYPKDAAYHNGTIWTWLTGPAVTILAREGLADSAFVLTRALERLSREDGAVGAIPECTDALPREDASRPRPSGTVSQAWSNAEYLRNWFQDYLGVHPSWTAEGTPVLRLAPALPTGLLHTAGDSVAATVRIGNNRIRISYIQDSGTRRLRLRHLAGRETVRIETGGDPIALPPAHVVDTTFPAAAIVPRVPVDTLPLFATARPLSDFATIRPAPWPRVDGVIATRVNPDAATLCQSFDAAGDDTGADGMQRYPVNALFPRGIADLRAFDVRADEELLYFTIRMASLTQPGWHPEYGFQLTLLAIAIDQSHDPAVQSRAIGLNSGFVLPEGRGYDRLITVGGGVRVSDTSGAVLCEFIPETTADAFGSVASGEIRFALPRSCLGGGYDHWRYTIIAGLQDDHGGAGIGEFRGVNPVPSQWNGSGNQRGVNWYDVMWCPGE